MMNTSDKKEEGGGVELEAIVPSEEHAPQNKEVTQHQEKKPGEDQLQPKEEQHPQREQQQPQQQQEKKPPPLENGTLIKGKWRIAGKIGQGAFGETYIGEGIGQAAEQSVAIKIERPSGGAKRDVLKAEVIALKKLQECPLVVRYVSSGRDEGVGVTFLVMQRLGCDVAELKKRAQKQTFELATTLRLGIQMLQAIQGVHEQHYIHRDIKPSNFVVGLKDPGNVYLIDFGLARRYRGPTGEIRPPRHGAGFRGTARYASIHSHKALELGRRDDLWSLFYVLVEFRLDGGLPWRKHKDKNTIGEIKERSTNEKLVEKLPVEFTLFMNHLFSLKYETEPDYDYLKTLLVSLAEKDNVSFTEPLEWERNSEEQNGAHTEQVNGGHMGGAHMHTPPANPLKDMAVPQQPQELEGHDMSPPHSKDPPIPAPATPADLPLHQQTLTPPHLPAEVLHAKPEPSVAHKAPPTSNGVFRDTSHTRAANKKRNLSADVIECSGHNAAKNKLKDDDDEGTLSTPPNDPVEKEGNSSPALHDDQPSGEKCKECCGIM